MCQGPSDRATVLNVHLADQRALKRVQGFNQEGPDTMVAGRQGSDPQGTVAPQALPRKIFTETGREASNNLLPDGMAGASAGRPRGPSQASSSAFRSAAIPAAATSAPWAGVPELTPMPPTNWPSSRMGRPPPTIMKRPPLLT